MKHLLRLPLLLVLPLGLAVTAAAQQTGGAGQQGGGGAPTSREAMWPAPTEEDWARPCLITWQRTFDDAIAVSRETQRPILVCVNMDGEIASEHYAGIRYRQAEIAALYEPYICVIASVYRHNPRDFDEQGRRIPCPRFGGVTCGEHIAIEPILYEQYFEGERVAPRHIMIELDGAETYDVYYAFDTASVFETIRSGVAEREFPPLPALDDRPVVERVGSRNVDDRVAVEAAYLDGDRELRRRLLRAAVEDSDSAPDGLLRLAVFDLDVELNQLARRALGQSTSANAVDLISEALRVPMDQTERAPLIRALERIGVTSPKARTLAVVHSGLSQGSGALDVTGWTRALEGGSTYPAPTPELPVLETQLESRAQASDDQPDDASAQLELAEAYLAVAADRQAAGPSAPRGRFADEAALLYEDARGAALEAERLGATGWRVNAALAVTALHLSDFAEASARAEVAVGELPPGETNRTALEVVSIFARSRQRSIARAMRAKEDYPPEWLTDLYGAYAILARHPLSTDADVVLHYDFLRWLGAKGPASRVLDEGLARYPESWALHDRLRTRTLQEKGIDGLEQLYDDMLLDIDASPRLAWYAGYASIVAAEFNRRAGRSAKALAAYHRALAYYDRCTEADPSTQDSCDHYAAIAIAGRARIAYESGNDERALEEILESFEREPDAAASLDGLNISPVGTAKMLLARLLEEEQGDAAARLQAALDALDPRLLELPEFERGGPRRQPGQGGADRRRGQRGR